MRPTIEINGKTIEMKTLKARAWREIMKFETERKEIETFEYVDKLCEIIAMVYGITTDEVLDNLEIGDVQPKYIEVLKAMVTMLYGKMEDKKNEDVEVVVQA